MEPQPTYEELAETIAQCVYDKIYLEVSRYYAENGELVIEKIVDNMSSSSFQIPTGVLNRLDIFEPLDTLQQRNDFTCTPDAFREKIARNKSKGCSYDTLVLALICLLTDHPNVKPVYDVLMRLDVCEPDTEPPYDKGQPVPVSILRFVRNRPSPLGFKLKGQIGATGIPAARARTPLPREGSLQGLALACFNPVQSAKLPVHIDRL